MTTVRLINDSYPFLKGTEFIVTGGHSGSLGSGIPFHSGTVIANGEQRRISVDRSDCKYISLKEYTGKVILHKDYINSKPMSDYDFWEEWINSPG